jgi:hypothetical protein
MVLLRSESESSAGFQPAVSQVFNLQGVRTGDLIASNRAFWSVESSEISSKRRVCRMKSCDTVPHTRADAGRYAFGPTSTIKAPKNHAARKELKPFWMQFKKDKAEPEILTWRSQNQIGRITLSSRMVPPSLRLTRGLTGPKIRNTLRSLPSIIVKWLATWCP